MVPSAGIEGAAGDVAVVVKVSAWLLPVCVALMVGAGVYNLALYAEAGGTFLFAGKGKEFDSTRYPYGVYGFTILLLPV